VSIANRGDDERRRRLGKTAVASSRQMLEPSPANIEPSITQIKFTAFLISGSATESQHRIAAKIAVRIMQFILQRTIDGVRAAMSKLASRDPPRPAFRRLISHILKW
jgi:hypothetical protein